MGEGLIHYPEGMDVAIMDGVTLPTGPRRMTVTDIMDIFQSAARMPYKGLDPKKKGKTLLEAGILSTYERAADGDLQAMNLILDRSMGKPVQQVNSLNATVTIKDLLDGIHQSERNTEANTDPFAE